MYKSYLPMLDSGGILLSILYIPILLAALIYISKLLKVDFPVKVITGLFLYYYLFFIAGTFVPFIPNMPDSALFANVITDNFYPYYQSVGVKLFYIIAYPIRILSFFKLEVFILFQISFFIISLMVIWKSWQIVLQNNHIEKGYGKNIFLFLSVAYPAFILYMPIPLREFFVLFGFSILVYGIISKYYENKGLIAIVIGTILLTFVRPQLIIPALILLALSQKNNYIKYGSFAAVIFLMPILFDTILGYSFSPKFFALLRHEQATQYASLSYGIVEWKTYFDILMDLPGLVLQFLLSPFAILHDKNPLSFLAILIDAIFCILIYVSVIFAGFKISKIYIYIFILSAILFSIWEFFIPGAVRHRLPLVAILLPAASYGIMKLSDKFKGRL